MGRSGKQRKGPEKGGGGGREVDRDRDGLQTEIGIQID